MTRIAVYETLPSTQTEALQRLRAGDLGPGWVRARRQTAGQGRMGRHWEGPSGNLMASWYGVMPIELRRVTQLSFVAALAVVDTLSPLLTRPEALKIKWPNDVLYDGRKLCGILVQSEILDDGRLGIVIGIGVNIVEAPAVGASYKTAALNSEANGPQSVEAVLVALDVALSHRLELWLKQGFADTAAQWWALAYGRGLTCLIEQGELSVRGTILGLDDYGALRVRDAADEVHLVTGGSVTYPES